MPLFRFLLHRTAVVVTLLAIQVTKILYVDYLRPQLPSYTFPVPIDFVSRISRFAVQIHHVTLGDIGVNIGDKSTYFADSACSSSNR